MTRAAPLFDQLVDMLLSDVEAGAGSLGADGSGHAPTPDELSALRERLDGHFPEFRRLYFTILEKHIGPALPWCSGP